MQLTNECSGYKWSRKKHDIECKLRIVDPKIGLMQMLITPKVPGEY